MANGSMKLFFVMLFNNTDQRDDEMLKIRTTTRPKALMAAKNHILNRGGKFTVGEVITLKQLKKTQPEWHSLLWGVEPNIITK